METGIKTYKEKVNIDKFIDKNLVIFIHYLVIIKMCLVIIINL